jgi:hypothetical protein
MIALILAAFEGHVNIVELLLAREEIEINEQDEVTIIIISSCILCVEYRACGASVDICDK